jgi:hypothetical protein
MASCVQESQAVNAPPRSSRRMLTIVAIVAAIAIGVFFYFHMRSNVAPVSPAATSQRVSVVNGVTVIVLDTATQERSGIRAEPLSVTEHQTEAMGYGTVLDLQPLIDLRTRFASAQADAASANAIVAASRQEFERNRVLYQDNQNTSLKALQATRAVFLTRLNWTLLPRMPRTFVGWHDRSLAGCLRTGHWMPVRRSSNGC